MRRSEQTAAAYGLLILLVIACVSVTLLRAAHAQESTTIEWQPIDQPVQPLEMISFVVISSSIVGILGWLLRFAARRDGIHRLAAVNPIYSRKLTT